jgi:hypothetical protein
MDYKKYIGQYAKRFYTPFDERSIWKIGDYREVTYFEDGKPHEPRPEFLYQLMHEEFWTDVDDSVIITNELPIIEDERVANVNHSDYKGFNPFKI